MSVHVAVVPTFEPIIGAVTEAGGRIVEPSEADAIVWMDVGKPQELAALLKESPARWIQLPMAGVEPYFEAGVIDTSHTWTCTKGAYGPATAEQALALLLTAARQLVRHARARTWGTVPMPAQRRLHGTTAVIVGTGGIGTSLAQFLEPLGVRIVAVNRSGRPVPWAQKTVASDHLPDVATEADWLVLAPALTPETTGMVDAALLSKMKPNAWVVNVGRGGLVDTNALIDALREKRIGGAALDVTDPEPLPDDHPLWGMDDVIITSHTANTALMAIPELAAIVAENVRRFAAGRPLLGLIDPAAGY